MVENLEDAFQKMMFPLDLIEHLREISFEGHLYKEEYLDDEDIQTSVLPAHQEENMMSCDPFEDLDDTLFHDFGSEEVLEEPLDVTDPLDGGACP
jgi:hypothetical protein